MQVIDDNSNIFTSKKQLYFDIISYNYVNLSDYQSCIYYITVYYYVFSYLYAVHMRSHLKKVCNCFMKFKHAHRHGPCRK